MGLIKVLSKKNGESPAKTAKDNRPPKPDSLFAMIRRLSAELHQMSTDVKDLRRDLNRIERKQNRDIQSEGPDIKAAGEKRYFPGTSILIGGTE